MAQRLARGAHNSEVTRSKRVAGISSSHRTGASRHFRGTYGSPLTPPFKYGQGVRGDSMSPAEQLSSLVAQRKRAVKHRQSKSRCENIRQTDGYRIKAGGHTIETCRGNFIITSHRCIKALEQLSSLCKRRG